MKLGPAVFGYLRTIQAAGANGVIWSPRHKIAAVKLIRMGLIEQRTGPPCETDGGRRTTLRFVAVSKAIQQLEAKAPGDGAAVH